MADRTAPLALVTGGARRVGRAICLTLANAGFDLLATYSRSEAEAGALKQEIESLGRSCETLRMPLDDPDALVETARSVASRLGTRPGRLDALVHNASAYAPTPIDDLTADAALAQYRVNALAPLLLTREFRPLLCRSPLASGGAVVAMVDIHAMGRPRKEFAAYSMSKAALIEMVRTLARELAPEIRVNGVAPGVVAWPDAGDESGPEAQRAYLSRVPLGRAGTPEEAAECVRWLIQGASYVTGSIVRVDGGRFIA